MEATAGGLFPVAAQWVLNQGGVVFGAAYDKQMRVVHCAAHDMDGVRRFNGSDRSMFRVTLDGRSEKRGTV